MYDISINTLFSVMFALVPFMVLGLLPHAGISLRRFSIPSLFIIFYFMSDYIGILLLYFRLDPYPVSLGVVDRTIIFNMFFYSVTALIIITFGFIYAHHVFGLKINAINYRVLMTANIKQRSLTFCLFLLCALILFVYLTQVDTVALFKALSGDTAGAAVARSNMGNAFQGKYWRYQIFFRHLLDYCVIFFFADCLIKRRGISLFFLGGSFFLAAFSATMAIEKGALIKLLIMLYLAYVIHKGGDYWQPAAKYFLIIMVSITIVLYIYFMNARNITSALKYIWFRVVTGQMIPAYFYLDLFPRHIDFLWGASFPNPGGLLPFKNFPLTMEVSHFIFLKDFARDIVGSAPTVFWGEMYANFGSAGIIFSSFFVGIGLFLVSHILSRLPLSPPVIAATASLAMHYRDLTVTSLSNYFFDTTLIAIGGVTLVLLLFSRRKIICRRIMWLKKCYHE